MGKFKNKLYSFMYGRYGNDTLGKALLWAYVALVLVSMIVSVFVSSVTFNLISLLIGFVLVFFIFYRMMSRNIAARRKENEKFTGFFKLMKNRFKDRKTHVYRKCTSCHAVLRLPKAKGKHTVVCPRCKNRFEVKG
ncbi:MAG: hypothetical protein ACI3XQ_07050 [Eubacteriales bacterium]